MTSRELLNRRNFLRRASGLLAGGTVANTLLDLRLINNAMATINVADYKALVCVFLAGGNDTNNMLLPAPTDPRYASYKATRGERLALWEDAAAAAARPTINGATNPNSYYARPLSNALTTGDYAVHSGMPAVQTLFNTGKLAFVTNTGVQVEPANKSQIQAKSRKLPPQLFSHNDQVTQWQTSVPDVITKVGWGGGTSDRMRTELANQGIPLGSISMSVSLAGSNTWEVGNTVNQFQVSTSGAVSLQLYSTRQAVIDSILRDPTAGGSSALNTARTNLHERDFQKVNERAIYNGASLATALTRLTTGQPDAASGTTIDTQFGIGGAVTYNSLNDLEKQLHTVARIIAERSFLGMRRQIFFVQLGGHDTHGDQPLAHNNLLATTSAALGKFYNATNALSVANKVTAFTASDFSRTFKSNGLGSDHAWGSHHMVCGGAVNGGRLYGTYPTLALNGPDDYDTGTSATGRWIPTQSVDEYSATLARWFGLDTAALNAVFPNLSRFPSSNLGFLV